MEIVKNPKVITAVCQEQRKNVDPVQEKEQTDPASPTGSKVFAVLTLCLKMLKL